MKGLWRFDKMKDMVIRINWVSILLSFEHLGGKQNAVNTQIHASRILVNEEA